MANRWLYAGGDLGTVRIIAGAPVLNTNAGNRNATYCDCSIGMRSGMAFATDFKDAAGVADPAVLGETLWFRTAHVAFAWGSSTNPIELVNSADQPWLALRALGGSSAGLFYNSGTGASPVWTQIGSNFTFTLSSTLHYVDFKVTLGSPHVVELHLDNALVASGSFTQASLSSLYAAVFRSTVTEYNFSEMMAAVGICTINGHVFTGKPNGAGASSGMSGASTTIDDVGVDDTDFVSSGTVGQRSTFAYSNLPSLGAGMMLGDLFMYTRAKNDGVSPLNLKPVRRTAAGVDGVGSAFAGMGAGFTEKHTRYTGITATEYDGSQFGMESAE